METAILLIIAKTTWDGGFCYLAYDPVSGRIRRPVPRSSADDAKIRPHPQNKPLQVGLWYKFQLIPGESNNLTLPPHSQDDIFVKPYIITMHPPKFFEIPQVFDYANWLSPLYATLQPLANDKICDIFDPSFVFKRRYVNAGTNCPSVGVFQCQLNQLRATRTPGSKVPRILIHCKSNIIYNFPFTARNAEGWANFINSHNRSDEPVLLLFSTGRPLNGYPPDVHFDPPRCYILVVGFIKKYLPRPFNPREFFQIPHRQPFHTEQLSQQFPLQRASQQFYRGQLHPHHQGHFLLQPFN
jgi:hypothetical protein